jgi:hypothetical protein
MIRIDLDASSGLGKACGGNRTAGLRHGARSHRVLDWSDRAVRVHPRVFSASLRRHPASPSGTLATATNQWIAEDLKTGAGIVWGPNTRARRGSWTRRSPGARAVGQPISHCGSGRTTHPKPWSAGVAKLAPYDLGAVRVATFALLTLTKLSAFRSCGVVIARFSGLTVAVRSSPMVLRTPHRVHFHPHLSRQATQSMWRAALAPRGHEPLLRHPLVEHDGKVCVNLLYMAKRFQSPNLRRVRVGKDDTTISVEPEFWDQFRLITKMQRTTISTELRQYRPTSNRPLPRCRGRCAKSSDQI